jgi:hypothetical protein
MFHIPSSVKDCEDNVDETGLYKDVNVINIDSDSDDSKSKNKDPKHDLNKFFDAPQRIKGQSKA